MWCRRFCVALVALMSVQLTSAQIRIVPQSRLDSVANPATVGDKMMRFADGAERDFGVLKESDDKWSTTLRWTNTGDKPLVVTRVTTSCSCVVAEASREVVKSGEQGTVSVSFNPQGRLGGVAQRVMIYTNLSERIPSAIVTLRGRVDNSAENVDYPVAMGDLRLQTRQALFSKGEGGRVSIACKNVGTRSLRVSADAMLKTKGVTLECEPAVLEAGAEGVLVVECDGGVEESCRVYVGGVEVAPRNRTIEIVIE